MVVLGGVPLFVSIRRVNTFSLHQGVSEVKMRIAYSGLFVGVEPPAHAGCLLDRAAGKRVAAMLEPWS